MGYKAYSDNYLMSLTKAQIIELLRVAEHNYFVVKEALNNSAKAGMELSAKYDKAKELLRLAVSDINYTLTNVDECTKCLYCDDETGNCSSTEKCYNVCKWKYSDEVMKLMEK